MTKTYRVDVKDEISPKGRMFETCASICPVSSFEKYVTKLHPVCDSFCALPHRNFDPNKSALWYVKIPLGKNTFGTKMSKLSNEKNLLRAYTYFTFITARSTL